LNGTQDVGEPVRCRWCGRLFVGWQAFGRHLQVEPACFRWVLEKKKCVLWQPMRSCLKESIEVVRLELPLRYVVQAVGIDGKMLRRAFRTKQEAKHAAWLIRQDRAEEL